MIKIFIDWYRRRFSDPDAVSLLIFIILFFIIIYFFNKILLPILIAVAFSYLLETPIKFLIKHGLPRLLAVSLVLMIFVSMVLLAVIILLPLIWQQGISLIGNIPMMLTFLNKYLMTLPQHYPELIDVGVFDSIISSINQKVVQTGNSLLQFSIDSIFSLLSVMINSVLIPVMMFLLLKDKEKIWNFCSKMLPKNRQVLNKVATEMDQQISNYIVGNVLHIIILFSMVCIPFSIMKLDYALLLAFIVAVSVIIPYIGIIISTIPIVTVALFQWGWSSEFSILIALYTLIQVVDGNLTVPLLFSERLNLHPLVIIIAVLIFGGLWGFWGVFFAIPLATLVKAIVNAWPVTQGDTEPLDKLSKSV